MLCRITPAGLRLLEQTDECILAPERNLARVWKASEARALVALMDRAREAMAGSRLPQNHPDQRSNR